MSGLCDNLGFRIIICWNIGWYYFQRWAYYVVNIYLRVVDILFENQTALFKVPSWWSVWRDYV